MKVRTDPDECNAVPRNVVSYHCEIHILLLNTKNQHGLHSHNMVQIYLSIYFNLITSSDAIQNKSVAVTYIFNIIVSFAAKGFAG